MSGAERKEDVARLLVRMRHGVKGDLTPASEMWKSTPYIIYVVYAHHTRSRAH